MQARRTTATIAHHEAGATTPFEHFGALQSLRDWAKVEVSHARTEAYREGWQDEVDASTEALNALKGAA